MFDAGLASAAHGHITQVDTVTHLFRAHYEAHTTVAEAFIDFTVGLGVAEACDGEIVACDDTVWRVPADGVPTIAEPGLGLPFAVVAHVGRPVTRQLPPGANLEAVSALIDEVLCGEIDLNLVAAARLDGVFAQVVLRSEHRQSPPYPPLPDVLSREVRFAFDTWEGTLVGFQFPDENDGVVIPGLHLHGISADRTSGGHCHEFIVVHGELTVWLDDVEIRVPHPTITSAVQAHQLLDEITRSGAPEQRAQAQVYARDLLTSPHTIELLEAIELLYDAVIHDPYLTRNN